MITQAERRFIGEHAYVPEHVPEYVCAISGAEAYLVDEFVAYVDVGRLIFIGYPLERSFNAKAYEKSFHRALKRFAPEKVNLVGPDVPSSISKSASVSRDYYYRLEIENVRVSQKVRNMLSRASKETTVKKSRDFGEEHTALIDEFLMHHSVGEATHSIFARIAEYVRVCETATLFDARNSDGNLTAFDVAESGAKDYLFHLFNFSSSRCYVPGASDLLMKEMISEASAQGKRFMNMGLGIDPGVTFFKTKWGGRPFLPYIGCEYTVPHDKTIKTLLDKL